MPLILYKICMC